MKKALVFICALSLIFIATACSAESMDERTAYLQLIDSTDFEQQVEVLPRLLEDEKFTWLFPSEQYDEGELIRIYNNVLLNYLIALMETDEDELLRDNVVEIFRSFRSSGGRTSALDLFILSDDYFDKLEIIIPEMMQDYKDIAEDSFWERFYWSTVLWQLLFRYNDYVEPEWLTIEQDDYLIHAITASIEFESQIYEGYITIDDVPERYVYQVELLIEERETGRWQY